MADPVGILGTAVGIVSFGLQLYDGISRYLDALEGRKEEISSTQRTLVNFKNALADLEVVLNSPQRNCNPVRDNAPSHVLASCKEDLNALQKLLSELQAGGSPATHLKGKVKENLRRMKYPFHREKLQTIRKQLDRTNGELQTVLHVLGFKTSISIQDITTDSQRIAQTISSNISIVQSDLSDAKQASIKSHQDTQRQVQRLEPGITNITSELETLSTSVLATKQGAEVTRGVVEIIHTKAESISDDTIIIKRQTAAVAPLIKASSARISAKMAESIRPLAEMQNEMLQTIQKMNSTMNTLVAQEPSTSSKASGAGGRLRQQPTQYQVSLGRAVSKPGYCKELCDEIERDVVPYEDTRSGAPGRHASGIAVRCRCPIRRIQGKRVQLCGLFSAYQEISEVRHVHGCRLANLGFCSQTRTWNVIPTRLRLFVSHIIQASFASTTGAGGFSLSHNVAAYPLIDARTAPAFRVMTLLGDTPIEEPEALARLIKYASSRIIRLYQDRKASPLDLDIDGSSLIHKFSNALHRMSPAEDYEPVATRFLCRLLELGVPGDREDRFGQLPIDMAVGTIRYSSPKSGACHLIQALYRYTEIPATKNLNYIGLYKSYFGQLPRQSQEALGYSPLAQAICCNDLVNIGKLLRANPHLLKEATIFGQTPLHLAAKSAACLEKIFEQRPDASDVINQVDRCHNTALTIAIEWSSHRCLGKDEAQCFNCDCYRPAQILLEHDCAVTIDTVSDIIRTFPNSPSCAMTLLLDHFADRRRRLEHYALECRPRSAQERVASQERILDIGADSVINDLRDENYKIPSHLRIIQDSARRTTPLHLYSVYYWIESELWAEELFSRKFLDINDDRSAGISPIMRASQRPRLTAPYILWLIGKGADLSVRTTAGNSVVCILLAKMTVQVITDEQKSRFGCSEPIAPEIRQLIHVLLKTELTDETACSCVKDGDQPLVAILRGYMAKCTDKSPSSIVTGLIWLINNAYMLDDVEESYAMTLRYITFEALGLQHRRCPEITIADHWGLDCYEARSDEHDWIDDPRRSECLESLLVYFEMEYSKKPVSLPAFLEDTWAPHMETIIRKLNDECKLSPEEIRNIEEVGVVWHGQVEEGIDEEAGKHLDEEAQTLEYWIRRVDEILPEYAGLDE